QHRTHNPRRVSHASGLAILRFRSPLLTESQLFSLPTGTEMFHFPALPPDWLYIHQQVTRHHSRRVSPFGHPRIHARLTAPRGISQPPTSFIGSQCQGIHHAPLHTYNTKPKNKSPTHTNRRMQDFKIAHQHTQKPTTPKGGDHHACQMLATTIHKSNTTPHHQSEATTTKLPRRKPTQHFRSTHLRFPTLGTKR